MLTTPDIVELLKRVKWDSFHTWISFHGLYAPVAAALTEFGRRLVKRRNARLAQHWPVVEGRVQSVDVKTGTRLLGQCAAIRRDLQILL